MAMTRKIFFINDQSTGNCKAVFYNRVNGRKFFSVVGSSRGRPFRLEFDVVCPKCGHDLYWNRSFGELLCVDCQYHRLPEAVI